MAHSGYELKFKALNIGVGDAFLLESPDCTILIDTGESENRCCEEVIRHVGSIDAVIITHYDYDHFGGLLSLLQSDAVSIKEVWLPEVFGRLAETCGKKSACFVGELVELQFSDLLKTKENPRAFPFCVEMQADDEYIYGVFLMTLAFACEMRAAIEIMQFLCDSRSMRSTPNIRWFGYSKCESLKNSIKYGVRCVNGEEMRSVMPFRDDVEALYYLSRSNRESLVFKAEFDEAPDVLFTADSDFSFMNSGVLELKRHSVVTAPHHGSNSNSNVYDKIVGDELIWVRSHGREREVASNYRRLKDKYCTKCANGNHEHEVSLEYDGTSWVPFHGNRPCNC